MVDLTKLQNKISRKVFDGLGSDLATSSLSTSSTDKWGDATKTYTSLGNIKAVPWNHVKDREGLYPFGELLEGQVDMAFKYDQTLGVGYLVSLNSELFTIKEVEKFPLKNGYLVQVARLQKQLP